jgi:methylenetetrahydrofolate reductase (NADPH)
MTNNNIAVSFEFFPPKTAKMEETLWTSIHRLEPLQPEFISVTYGAGGSTRERTHATIERILNETGLSPAAHLTCVDASKSQVDEVIRGYKEIGVKRIVALRGDPPAGADTTYEPHPDGYSGSVDLVAGIKEIGDFEIYVGTYPEKHPESSSIEHDIDMLQKKVDAGASQAITQFFFDNSRYLQFLEKVRARGITIPVTPGIIPIHNFKQVARFAKMCQAHIPQGLAERFEGLDDDPETTSLIAATVAAEQVMDLRNNGVCEFHFYTLNRANMVYAICHLLGLRPRRSQ